jgi:photosystem II stability/assembly factor-like uncharacterized protein
VLVFSPADHTSLYLGTQYVMKTLDGGLHWRQISPDLTGTITGTSENGPTTDANAEQRGLGVVYTIAPSPLKADEIWVGSDTGLIHLTTDGGKTWRDVTPPGLSPWSKISIIEASHFDPATAFAAIDRHRLDDQKPYIYITHDFGKSWKLAVNGIPANSFVRAMREDTVRKNLLFAGTELGIYVSFDGGNDWQPLQLNLPIASVRDMDVHGSDLIVATHGRSFWVLDDIAPLRQAAAAQEKQAYLYAPPAAVRVDNDGFLGTPLPPEEPQANNPPDGAIVDYYLQSNAKKVSLQILDSRGRVIRHYSSEDKTTVKRPLLPIAERWFPKPQVLETEPGEHRFVWDLRVGGSGTGMGGDDDSESSVPPGPRVAPGTFTVRLSVDGTTMEQPLKVTMDSRAAATSQVLDQQFMLADSIYTQTLATRKAMAELESVEAQLKKEAGEENDPAELRLALHDALQKLDEIKGGENGPGEGPTRQNSEKPGLADANAGLGVALAMVESGDRAAPSQAIVIFNEMSKAARAQIEAWKQYKAVELNRVNAALTRAQRKPLQISAIEEQVHYAMTR